jgi:methionyl-tRNA formyltransferase
LSRRESVPPESHHRPGPRRDRFRRHREEPPPGLADTQYDLFTDAWPAIEADEVETTPQDESAGEYHSVEDFQELCELDPNEEVRVKDFLDRLRGLTFLPFDNARIEVDGETYYVDVEIRSESDDSEPDGLLSPY